MVKLDERSARIAAKWWADRLRSGAKLDNADPSQAGGMAFIMGKILQNKMAQKRTLEQVQVFEDSLFEELRDQKTFTTHVAGVDYHPTGVFLRAAEKAGIKLGGSCLPWKTHMYYIDGVVKVSYGYGAPIESIEAEVSEPGKESVR